MRVFLDTNILLDVLLNRPGLVRESEAVILRCEQAGHRVFIAWHGLATTYYLLRRGRTEDETMREVVAHTDPAVRVKMPSGRKFPIFRSSGI
jgi:predicted nucleic acid-binding protein